MVTKDTYLAVFIILISIAAYIVSYPYPYNSSYFPRFIILLLGLLGAALLVKELRKGKTAQQIEQRKELASAEKIFSWNRSAPYKVILMAGSSIVYLIVLDQVGFFVTTLIYLPIMIRLLGVRKIRTIGISTCGVVFFIYLIFGMFLRVPFPEGLLF